MVQTIRGSVHAQVAVAKVRGHRDLQPYGPRPPTTVKTHNLGARAVHNIHGSVSLPRHLHYAVSTSPEIIRKREMQRNSGIMGFDLFMAAVAIVIAAIATWGILKVLLGADTEADVERARSGAGEIAVDVTGSGSTTSHDAASANAENSGESGEIRNGNASHGDGIGAAGTSASEMESAPETAIADRVESRYVGKRLVIAAALTIPAFTVSALLLGGATVPGWLANPWLHAIVITPVMFYCAAPIHRLGLAALKRRMPNADSLMSLGMWIVYACNLLLCVISSIFSENLHAPYFAFIGIVTALSLAITLIRRHVVVILFDGRISESDNVGNADDANVINHANDAGGATGMAAASGTADMTADDGKGAEERILRAAIRRTVHAHVLRVTTAVTMVVAVWTFALWMAFGLQPKLPVAILISATVLAVAGLVLQACDRTSDDR